MKREEDRNSKKKKNTLRKIYLKGRWEQEREGNRETNKGMRKKYVLIF